ncbi:MAG: TonB family protein [Sphingomonas bacterium]|nr:TonB family protein [Sphingomonas bacterium]
MVAPYLALLALSSAAAPSPLVRAETFQQTLSTVVDVQYNEAGKVTSCRVLKSSGSAQADREICENIISGKAIMRRGFESKKRGVIADLARNSGPGPAKLTPDPPGTPHLRIHIERAGSGNRCAVTETSGVPTLDEKLCAYFRLAQKTRPQPASPPPKTIISPHPNEPTFLNFLDVFSTEDYPADALRKEEQGTVRVEVAVDEAGSPTDCQVVNSSRSAAFDAASCVLILARGRFEPLLDSAQRPVAGVSKNSVRWALPVFEALPIQDDYTRAVFAVNADGTLGKCTAEGIYTEYMTTDPCKSLGPGTPDWVKKSALVPANLNRKLAVEAGTRAGKGESLRQSEQAMGQELLTQRAVTLSIDTQGAVTDCVKAQANMSEAPNGEFCNYLRSMKYEPVDASEADRSDRYITHYNRVFWRD